MGEARTTGTWFTSEDPRPTPDRAQRVCAVEGCTTVLSVYNTTALCWAHRRFHHPRGRWCA